MDLLWGALIGVGGTLVGSLGMAYAIWLIEIRDGKRRAVG